MHAPPFLELLVVPILLSWKAVDDRCKRPQHIWIGTYLQDHFDEGYQKPWLVGLFNQITVCILEPRQSPMEP